MQVYRFPHYGFARGGTNRYERGGHAYGGWSGLGDGGVTTPAAVAMIPEPQPIPTAGQQLTFDKDTYAATLQDQARQAQANAIAAAALNNPFAFAANAAAAVAMTTKAKEVAAGAAPITPAAAVAPGSPNWLWLAAGALGLAWVMKKRR